MNRGCIISDPQSRHIFIKFAHHYLISTPDRNTMRTKIVAGNWKMNKTFSEAESLVAEILDLIEEKGKPENADIILFPPFPYLEMAREMVYDYPVFIGAQNVSQFESGAYTGEVAAPMLRSMDIDYCLVGHSERRKYFGETDPLLALKIKALLKNDVVPVFCCGETLEERQADRQKEIVGHQLEEAVFVLGKEDFNRVLIAYEPVWAIGTGVNATPEQAQEMHAFIRELIGKKFGPKPAEEKTILYGGSCNPGNAAQLFAMPDVDGGLIGGASLDAREFYKIIAAAGNGTK